MKKLFLTAILSGSVLRLAAAPVVIDDFEKGKPDGWTVYKDAKSPAAQLAVTDDAISGDGALKMSPEMQEAVDVFTDFMYQGVYYNPIAKGEERKVQNILGSIWEYYVNHIDELPAVYQSIADDEGPQRAVCDYVSGMTDSYALEVYSELFIPAAWTIK